ncbi:hypothetical protein K501DRAFT_265036 [Backusella circina FSU 941]|nr:hypothetical protein K501DRAFT_265036 [Backusella circina FSU 941]
MGPILLLPSINKERSRLLRWRLAWLPLAPSRPCLCDAPKANYQHFDICSYTQSSLLRLHYTYLNHKQHKNPDAYINIATCKSLIDSVLNDLPPKFNEQTDSIWIELWPSLLQLPFEIDMYTSNSKFEHEPSAGRIDVDRFINYYLRWEKHYASCRFPSAIQADFCLTINPNIIG